MASADSAYSDAGHIEHSTDRDCSLLVGRKNAGIFDAFLDEFAGGRVRRWRLGLSKCERTTNGIAIHC